MINVGDIVEVKNESKFDGMQAEVIKTNSQTEPGYPIEVKFHEKYSYMFGSSLGREPGYDHVLFKEDELKKIEEWSFELRCYRLFKNNFHHTAKLKKDFNSENICCISDCSEKNSQRILVNIWGTVCEFDVCLKHAEQYHCKLVDDVPIKK